jgi:adenylate cyclase/guanylate cyclase
MSTVLPAEAPPRPASRALLVGQVQALQPGYELGLVAYRAPPWTYAFLAAWFTVLRVRELVVLNILAIPVALLAGRLHARGEMVRAFGLGLALTAVHAWGCAFYVGWEAGYGFFLVPLCVFAAFSPGVPRATRSLFFSAALLSWMGGYLLLSGRTPAHALPAALLRLMHVTNTAGALLTVSLWGRGLVDRLAAAESRAAAEHARSEALLSNILPADISERLKRGEDVSQAFERVSVVFADLVGFTPLSARKTPSELVTILDDLFSRIDALAERHGVEKIKTLGDAYMAAAGLPAACEDPAHRMATFALDLVALFESLPGEDRLRVRVGIATGPVVAGVIGARKFAYDAWGDTVNTAARMESHGTPGRVHVDDATRQLLGSDFRFEDRGELEVKGKGRLRTWFLEGRAGSAAA